MNKNTKKPSKKDVKKNSKKVPSFMKGMKGSKGCK